MAICYHSVANPGHLNMKQVVPLECNPDIFNVLAANFGVNGVEFHDIFSLDQDMLGFIPRPVLAVLLVFPISEAYENYRKEQDKNVQDYNLKGDEEDAVWYKQTISNACGTMAFLHAAANNLEGHILEDGPLHEIIEETYILDPDSRARYLENSNAFETIHNTVATEGDTSAPDAGDNVEFHYVCLTRAKKSGKFVELDGRRKGPVYRGDAVDDMLQEPVIKVIQEFLSREGNGAFSMLALCES